MLLYLIMKESRSFAEKQKLKKWSCKETTTLPEGAKHHRNSELDPAGALRAGLLLTLGGGHRMCVPEKHEPFLSETPKTGLATASAQSQWICCDAVLLRLHIFHGLDNFHGFCLVIFKSLPFTELAPRLKCLMHTFKSSLGSFLGFFADGYVVVIVNGATYN